MDDFKTIYIYENLLVVYFLINGRFSLVSLRNPTFSNIFPHARHVLMTFELWTLCACFCIFSLYISHLLLSSQQASIAMWTILISKSWWWFNDHLCKFILFFHFRLIKPECIKTVAFQNKKKRKYLFSCWLAEIIKNNLQWGKQVWFTFFILMAYQLL